MFRSIRKHLNPTSLIAMVALFVALGGVSYAAATISGSSLVNKSVAGKKLKDKTVTGGKVKNDSLTGTQVKESTLGKVPSAASADQAASAATATNATNADNATNATNATTAANATAISDDTVSSSKVQDGTLTGSDVGRRAGNISVPVNNVPANACVERAVHIDPTDADMRNDAFAVTAEQTWPTGLVFSTENSDSPGYVRINVCNVTGVAIDPGSETFHWVAFDS